LGEVALKTYTLARDSIQIRRSYEQVTRLAIGVAPELVKGYEKYVHVDARSTK
jgi:hypothetical protein